MSPQLLIHEIPEDSPLSALQARIRECETTGKTWISETIRKELSHLKYPLLFMGFESLNPAIPRFQARFLPKDLSTWYSRRRQYLHAGKERYEKECVFEDRDVGCCLPAITRGNDDACRRSR